MLGLEFLAFHGKQLYLAQTITHCFGRHAVRSFSLHPLQGLGPFFFSFSLFLLFKEKQIKTLHERIFSFTNLDWTVMLFLGSKHLIMNMIK